MDESTSPYRAGAGEKPAALLGRGEITAGFHASVKRALDGRPGSSRALVGLRGVGKTVLLNEFIAVASKAGAETTFVEAGDSDELGTLLAFRLRPILLRLSSETQGRVKKAVGRALGALRSFTLQLPGGASVSIDVEALLGVADSGKLVNDLTDLLVAVGEAARECNTALALAIDEAQYLSEEEAGALIAAVHRTTQLNLPIAVAVGGLPQFRAIAGNARSYAERSFDFIDVEALEADDAVAVIVQPAEQSDATIEPAAAEYIAEQAHGYPYFLQLWGHLTWLTAPTTSITLSDAKAASDAVIKTLDRSFFRVRYDRTTPKEREYLRAMAELGAGPHRSGDIATELGVKAQSVAPRRAVLIRKGMIFSPAHGDIAFTVPLFDEFMKRELPPDIYRR